MMTADDAHFEEYRNTFPSDRLLEMYFATDTPLFTLRNGAGVSLHDEIRYTYDTCIRAQVMLRIRSADMHGGPIEPIILFAKGVCAPWLRDHLTEHGLYFHGLYEFELYSEFRTQLERAPFYADNWWEWFMTDDTIGIRLVPGANPNGGNQPRRTLD